MKTYIDLEKGIAYGYGKAHEFRKSKSCNANVKDKAEGSTSPSALHNHRMAIRKSTPTILTSLPCDKAPSIFTTMLREMGVDYIG